MNRLSRLQTWVVAAGLLLAIAAPPLRSQTRDTVAVIQSPGSGAYRCCYDFAVTGRHKRGSTITEFRVRVVSGGATLVPGQSASPPDWTLFQNSTSIRWSANTSEAEIDSAETVNGFHFCVADTGIFRVVWETRNLDSLFTSDTLAFVCTGKDCDEPFFTPIPSDQACVYDMDIVNGNRVGATINDFHLRLLTPGAKFLASPSAPAPGWRLLQPDSAHITYIVTNGLTFKQWAEGFRFALNGTDSVRVAWWSTTFGDPVCGDTVTLRCGMSAVDSLRISRSATDSCCQDLVLKNAHRPATSLDGFSIRVLTPGARFSAAPKGPSNWTTVVLNASADSMAAGVSGGFAVGDTALFRSVCFDNSAATSDTVNYRWHTYYRGVAVTTGTGRMICIRPLTVSDSLGGRVDSSTPASSRCLLLTLRNRNSRNTAITRLVVRPSNLGTRRPVLSASAPAGWTVQGTAGDSVVFAGGSLAPGGTLAGFSICLGSGDATTREPLHLAWNTSNGLGGISTGALDISLFIDSGCDSAAGVEVSSAQPEVCCFRIRFHNRNIGHKTVDAVLLTAVSPSMIFSDASGGGNWSLVPATFPSTTVGFKGGALAPGDSTPELNICVAIAGKPTLPITVPVAWNTFANDSLVCSDTLRLVCTGTAGGACDIVRLIGADDTGGCSARFRVVNLHTPASAIDGVTFRITSGSGRFSSALVSGQAASWSQIIMSPTQVLFKGDSLRSLDSVESFILRFDSAQGNPVAIEACTARGDQTLCCTNLTVTCAAAGVGNADGGSAGLAITGVVPDPFSDGTDLHLSLPAPLVLRLRLLDATGKVVRTMDEGRLSAGGHVVHLNGEGLPSGIYYVEIEGGGGRSSRRVVLVR